MSELDNQIEKLRELKVSYSKVLAELESLDNCFNDLKSGKDVPIYMDTFKLLDYLNNSSLSEADKEKIRYNTQLIFDCISVKSMLSHANRILRRIDQQLL